MIEIGVEGHWFWICYIQIFYLHIQSLRDKMKINQNDKFIYMIKWINHDYYMQIIDLGDQS